MKLDKMMRVVLAMIAAGLTASLMAMSPIPKESGKALGKTSGKNLIHTGIVFIDGKYIEPPYRVERWGNGIRVNGMVVISEVVAWPEFLKTQSGVKVTKSETPVEAAPVAPPPAPVPAPAPVTETASDDDADSALDDLFDDDPKPKKAKKPSKPAAPVVKAPPKPPKPKVTVSYSMEGDFVPNDASRKLVKRINAVRQEIDLQLRNGCFVCFGDNYARVSGDERSALQMLERLPELQKRCDNPRDFLQSVRNAGMVYLTDALCDDLFRNRVDYRRLQERREKWKRDIEMRKIFNGTQNQLF